MKEEKIRKTDYSNIDRPRTRLAQFFDIFKHRFVELLKLSLLQTVFNMPLIASIVMFYILLKNASSINSLMTIFLMTGGFLFISMVSSFIGLSGVFYCMKKMIYMEGEYASSDFFVGLRDNYKKALITGVLAGLSVALTIIGSFFFYFYLSNINATIAGFGIAILVIQSIIVFTICYYTIMQIVIYENEYKSVLKNSLIFTLIRSPFNLGLFIIHPGIIVALMSIMEITMYVSLVILVLFSAIFHLMWSINIVSTFDKFINKEYHPDFYKKGLYIEEAE